MAIVAPIAGAYTNTWAGSAMGYTRSGYNLHYTLKGEKIEETDIYGLSLIDIVYRGAQMTIDATLKIYQAASVAPLITYVASFGQIYAAGNPIATTASSKGQALVLTVVANTSAALAGGPNTLTAIKTVPSPDNDFTLVLNSVVREIPLRFDVLTNDATGTGSLFSLT